MRNTTFIIIRDYDGMRRVGMSLFILLHLDLHVYRSPMPICNCWSIRIGYFYLSHSRSREPPPAHHERCLMKGRWFMLDNDALDWTVITINAIRVPVHYLLLRVLV